MESTWQSTIMRAAIKSLTSSTDDLLITNLFVGEDYEQHCKRKWIAFEAGFGFTTYSQRSDTSDRNLHVQRSGGAEQVQLCDDLARGRQRDTQSHDYRKSSAGHGFRTAQMD